ncbi:MAG: primosomal protein N' [Deltaproteobacteria bacterium]|nr:primosomal protein N' [Deltaproteobacteria bacterium]
MAEIFLNFEASPSSQAEIPVVKHRPCIEVAVPVPVKRTFLYEVPEGLLARTRVGNRVLVPFKNREITGYVLKKDAINNEMDLKTIVDVLDEEPFFNEQMIPFFKWLSHYYRYPVGQVIKSSLPGGINSRTYRAASLTDSGLAILNSRHLKTEDKEILSWISGNQGKTLPWPVQKVYPFQKKGWLVVQECKNKKQTGPLVRRFVKPETGVDFDSVIAGNFGLLKTGNETHLLKTVFASKAMLLSEVRHAFSSGARLVKKWEKKGVLKVFEGEVYRNPAGEIISAPALPQELNSQQKNALNYLRGCLDSKTFSSCLLFGVTGSGKTEVYYQAVKHAISLGRRAILMVPEIALAVYMEGLFRSRMGDRIAIYHSGLSRGERYDQWMRMVRGQVDLVIGARSALFSPLSDLGLIIVDEEHDSAYKQETKPRYQARDAAVVRAKMENAVVVLGSGTPSIQSFQNTVTGRYKLILMPDRIEMRPLPVVEVVDMRSGDNARSKSEMISRKLMNAVEENLKAGNQTLLFLNRRGFHRVYICRSCGQVIHCPNCDVALVYHLKEDRLFCHYCGFSTGPKSKCTYCGREGLRAYGFGTEKLESELKEIFPYARIARMDTDSTRKKGRALQILKRFSEQDIDILIGTQMITKGYDFPEVTLVGVIAADMSLSFPDFRAGERTFQVLSQIAGRAGRGRKKGKVVIQTFNPDHYAVRSATAHSYQSFFREEIKLRNQLSYPPFSYLASLMLYGADKEKTAQTAVNLNQGIRMILGEWQKAGEMILILGPAEASISKLKGKHRWQILIKSHSISLLQKLMTRIEDFSKDLLRGTDVQLVLDVDPYQMA